MQTNLEPKENKKQIYEFPFMTRDGEHMILQWPHPVPDKIKESVVKLTLQEIKDIFESYGLRFEIRRQDTSEETH